MNTKTFAPKKGEIKRGWHLIDADGKVLGRLAVEVAKLLRGKEKTIFTPYVDCGDFVVILNAGKSVLTGKKLDQKTDFRHSGYVGGTTFTPYRKLMIDHPTRAIKLAVKGMLPKNKLASRQITRLKVYAGTTHPHAAQFRKKEVKTEEKAEK
jgi:large subunit ribosomal protein L13